MILIIRSRVVGHLQREVARGVLGPWSAFGGNLSAGSRLVVRGNRGGGGGGGGGLKFFVQEKKGGGAGKSGVV